MAGVSRGLIEVGISMVLKDSFSNQAGKLSSAYVGMLNDMNNWNRAVMNSAGVAFDYGTKAIGVMTDAYKHYASISGEMFMVGKIAGANAKEQMDLLNLTRKVNMETPLTNMDIASGERYLAMAGNTAAEIQNMIRPAAQLASIFQMSLGGKGGVADLMTNIMKTFSISSDQAEKVADILYTATTSANINLVDLAQSLQYSGAVFRNTGVDLTTASAAIGILGDQGIQASSAGTALANMMRYLTLSVAGQKVKGAEYLKKMGISREDLVDAQGNLKDLGSLMKVIYKGVNGLNNVDKETALYNIFGVRGERAASALIQGLGSGADKLTEVINKANGSDGVVNDVNKQWLNTDQGALNQLTSAIDNLKMTMGQAEGGIFKPIVKSFTFITKLLEKLSGTGLGRILIRITSIVVIQRTIVAGIRLLSGIIKIVNYNVQAISGGAVKGASGFTAMNTQAGILEAHVRNIHAMMVQIVGMQYAPGTRGMFLPMGGRIGKNKSGMVYVTAGGRNYNPSNYVGGVVPVGVGAAAGTAAATRRAYVAPTAATTSRAGIIGRKALSMGRGIGGFAGALVGGWPGVLITAAAIGIPMLIDAFSDNTDALQSNTKAVENQQDAILQYQQEFINAWKNAQIGSDRNLHITVNGQTVNATEDHLDLGNEWQYPSY